MKFFKNLYILEEKEKKNRSRGYMNLFGEKGKYLVTNLTKGLVWLIIILATVFFIRKAIDIEYIEWLVPVYGNLFFIYLIFTVSEVVFGIIPPEIFMLWALETTSLPRYILLITSFSVISYLAGILGYWIGSMLNRTNLYKFLYKRVLYKYENALHKFGLYLIIVAALTPIPFSAICMLVGAVKYSFEKFLLYAGFRFIRYAVYSYIIWQMNVVL